MKKVLERRTVAGGKGSDGPLGARKRFGHNIKKNKIGVAKDRRSICLRGLGGERKKKEKCPPSREREEREEPDGLRFGMREELRLLSGKAGRIAFSSPRNKGGLPGGKGGNNPEGQREGKKKGET